MKQRMPLFFVLLVSFASVAQSQLNWVSNNGPYHAFIDDYAVGSKNGQVVLYAADSSETSLMKSTDRGETWTHVLSLAGAFVNCVATFKSNADIVYAGSRTGQASTQGIWKSTNGGTTWTLLSSQPSNKVVSRIAIHPTNSDIVWVGCWRVPVSDPPVAHRSTDGGQSWLPFTLSNNRLNVSDIAVAENTNNIWASTYNNGSLGNEGVWQTIDGGTNWAQRTTGMDGNNLSLASLAIDPNNPDVLYAGNNTPNASAPRKLYKTVNGTTQCTWSEVYAASAGFFYFSDIRVSPHSSSVVYASSGGYDNGVGVLKSTDAGASWTPLTNGILQKKLRAIEVDPLSSSLVYTGGFGAHYKSFDAGGTWQEKNTGLLFPTSSAVAKNGANLFSVGRGYFFRSTNTGSTWQVVFDELFMLENRKSIAFDPNDGNYALASFGDADGISHFWRTTNKGDSWTLVYFHPVPPVLATNNQAVLTYEGVGSNNVFSTGYYNSIINYGFVLKSADRGTTWNEVFNQELLKFNALTAKGNTVYVGGNSAVVAVVHKSTNAGSGWVETSNGLPTGSGKQVNSLSVDPADDKIVFAGTSDGVYRTDGGGDVWSAVNSGITHLNINSIVVHPVNRTVVYCASNDANNKAHVYRTVNGGQGWIEISSGLPLSKITEITFDRTNPNTAYTTTDSGVYHIAHKWTGNIAANTAWKTGDTYLVEGTLTVAAGVTLTVEQGAIVKFMQNAELKVDGVLTANAMGGPPITFTSLNAGEMWKGITFGTTIGSQVQYANISNAQTAISARHDNGLSVAHCTITGGTIGVYLYESGGGGNPPTSITDNTIVGASSQGIFADVGASMAIIQNNTLQGPGNYGMFFVVSSPVQVVGNKASGFDKAGIYCEKASPGLVNRLAGGHNCSTSNEIGVYALYYSNPILGRAVSSQSGLNSFASNVSFQIALEDNCFVYAEDNFWRVGGPDPNTDFSVDATSMLFYDPFLDSDPNGCTGGSAPFAGRISGKEIRDGMSNGPLDDQLAQEAIRMRLQRRHAEAMGVLRAIIASPQSSEELVRWAVNELLANYQAVSVPAPSNRLSQYLRTLLQNRSNNQTKRIIRDVMAPACLHEGDGAGVLAALDESIRLYPNTTSEVLALYSKVSFALNVAKDIQLAQNTLQILTARYPGHELTHLATVLVRLYRNEQRTTPTSSGKFVVSMNSSSERPRVYSLDQNYPNPFNPSTTINFDLPEPSHVSLVVYDVLGRKVAEIANGLHEAGYHSATWNASDVASGVYFARFTATDVSGNLKLSKVNKLLLTK